MLRYVHELEVPSYLAFTGSNSVIELILRTRTCFIIIYGQGYPLPTYVWLIGAAKVAFC